MLLASNRCLLVAESRRLYGTLSSPKRPLVRWRLPTRSSHSIPALNLAAVAPPRLLNPFENAILEVSQKKKERCLYGGTRS